MKAVIVDDIKESRINLLADLRDYCPDVEVIGEADGVVSALKLLKQQTPDLVFLDIQLLDGSGFDILELLPKVDFKVIFTTASDAFAIKAFKFSAIDYLLKPIDPDELMHAVKQAKHQQAIEKSQLEVLMSGLKKNETTKRLALHTTERVHLVEVTDIVHCVASDNYTQFVLKDGSKILVSKTLKSFETLLQEEGFFRVHQSHLINIKHIKTLIKRDGGFVLMANGDEIPIASRKRAEIFKLVQELH